MTTDAAKLRIRELSGNLEALVDLGELALQFGKVERITYHPDCKTQESDATHTVMLIWAACSLARVTEPQLDLGLIAQLAAVHDAPEALCGDTQTLKISQEERAEKQDRERKASAEIGKRFADRLDWLPSLLSEYELQDLPEARFVRAVDKCMPAITHFLNGGHALRAQAVTREELGETNRRQLHEVSTYAGEFKSLVSILTTLQARILRLVE